MEQSKRAMELSNSPTVTERPPKRVRRSRVTGPWLATEEGSNTGNCDLRSTHVGAVESSGNSETHPTPPTSDIEALQSHHDARSAFAIPAQPPTQGGRKTLFAKKLNTDPLGSLVSTKSYELGSTSSSHLHTELDAGSSGLVAACEPFPEAETGSSTKTLHMPAYSPISTHDSPDQFGETSVSIGMGGSSLGSAAQATASHVPYRKPNFHSGNTTANVSRASTSNASEYYNMIKTNAYTGALLPQTPSPNVQIPINSIEARQLFKKGSLNKPRPDPVPQPSVSELEAVLKDLRKRYERSKVMTQGAGIDLKDGAWERINAIVNHERPNLKAALKEQNANGLKQYVEKIENWDKAVGQKVILMKRILYKEQIIAVEQKILQTRLKNEKEATSLEKKAKPGEDTPEEGSDDNTQHRRDQTSGEWKGSKTKMGRRFSGLIEML